MMYTTSCANMSCSLGIYQSTVPPFYQAGKIKLIRLVGGRLNGRKAQLSCQIKTVAWSK